MPARFDVRTLDAYEWVHDLVTPAEVAREVALTRHHALLWRRDRDGLTGTIIDPVHALLQCDLPLPGEERGRLEPYAVLFLQWEARFPQQWRESWTSSPWTTKEAVLAAFIRQGALPETRTALQDLLVGAVHRVQRCQDRWYWRLARHIDGPALQGRLRHAVEHGDERVRLRARYVLWLIEHPEEVVTSRAWRRWRRTVGVAGTSARSAPQLSALPAAQAAASLVGLSTAELAVVFEALEAGPAARIAAAIEDRAAVARAVEAMDARTAARMLRGMAQPKAAELLAGVSADAAAARFPPPGQDRILRLMNPAAALARLSAMAPSTAAGHLRLWPAADSAEMFTAMDPAHACLVLAAMDDWWKPGEILAAMPDHVAQDLLARVPQRDRARMRWQLEMARFHSAARTSASAGERQERPTEIAANSADHGDYR